MNRKALITSLTLAAAAGAISCTAASAVETPTPTNALTITSDTSPALEPTRDIDNIHVVRGDETPTAQTTTAQETQVATAQTTTAEADFTARPAVTPAVTPAATNPVYETPGKVEAPTAKPAQETPAQVSPNVEQQEEGNTAKTDVTAKPAVTPAATAVATNPAPGTLNEVEAPVVPSPAVTTPVYETPGEVEAPVTPSPAVTTPVYGTPGTAPATPSYELTTPAYEAPAGHQSIEDATPVNSTVLGSSAPAPKVTENPGEAGLFVAPSSGSGYPGTTVESGAGRQDSSEAVSAEAPTTSEQTQADTSDTSEYATSQDSDDGQLTGEVEVVLAPTKQPTALAGADTKSQAASPTETSTNTLEIPGIAIGAVLLGLIISAGVWVAHRKNAL